MHPQAANSYVKGVDIGSVGYSKEVTLLQLLDYQLKNHLPVGLRQRSDNQGNGIHPHGKGGSGDVMPPTHTDI